MNFPISVLFKNTFFLYRFHYVAQVALELMILLPQSHLLLGLQVYATMPGFEC
jgi:hypothetical protein